MKNNEKGFATIVSVGIIILVFLAGYLVVEKKQRGDTKSLEPSLDLNTQVVSNLIVFNTREECEGDTKKQCVIAECDYAPEGIKSKNVCVNDYKYWKPSGQNVINDKDWKTYTNTEYGFEFQYPKDLYVTEKYSGSQIAIEGAMGGRDVKPMYIEISKNNVESDAQWGDIISHGTITLGSFEWDVWTLDSASDESFQYILSISHLDFKYYIIVNDQKELDQNQKEILSTFKFTK